MIRKTKIILLTALLLLIACCCFACGTTAEDKESISSVTSIQQPNSDENDSSTNSSETDSSQSSSETNGSQSSSETQTPQKNDFTTIVFGNQTLDYDGESHTITASGIPSDAKVQYTNNGPFVNAGEYDITIKVTADNYNDYTKTVVLKINKIDFSGISFKNKKVAYDGEIKTISVSGNIPDGTNIQYSNNSAKNKGEYTAYATLTNPNYNDKTLSATLTIIELVESAKEIMDRLMTRPDAWSFMPQAFSKENLAYSTNPTIDFSSSFVNVSTIKTKFIGQQMYVLWEGVYGLQSFLTHFDTVYAVAETIAQTYQTFMNANPDDYACWQAEVAGFNVKIELNGTKSTLLAGNNLFSLELYSDSDNNINTGRIEVTSNEIANYKMTDNSLTFSVLTSISSVANLKQVYFVRESGAVSGYFYEYTGTQNSALKTSAVISFNDNYSIVMSAKRESTDLIINGYEEVYSATTGEYLSGEVEETNKLVEYDTHWVNIYDVQGITTIKAIRNENLTGLSQNLHDVYINGSSEKFTPEHNYYLLVKTSRHYDIEMKDVYYIVSTVEENGPIKYETVKTEIPMLFIQESNIEDFGTEALENNSTAFSSEPVLPLTNVTIAQTYYDTMQTTLNTIKELITYEELINSLGTKNSFFTNE